MVLKAIFIYNDSWFEIRQLLTHARHCKPLLVAFWTVTLRSEHVLFCEVCQDNGLLGLARLSIMPPKYSKEDLNAAIAYYRR